MIALKTLIFTVFVPGTVLLYVPYALGLRINLPTLDVGAWRYTGLLLFAVGLAASCWCAFDFTVKGRGTPAPFDPPKRFVTAGLYRFVRNPMYVGGLLIVLGQFVYSQALVLLLYAAFLFLAFHTFVILYEEPTLRRTFGATYVECCALVPRWLPRLNPLPRSQAADLTREGA